jgi:hypothetical protein
MHEFISPDASLESLDIEQIHKKLEVPIFSGNRADFTPCQGLNPTFDKIAARLGAFNVGYEDQCSTKYYFDLFQCLQNSAGKVSRITEVGVYMGGASVILAGAANDMSLDLDLIDLNDRYLRFTYERIRRIFPEYAPRVRLFHGTLPHYVREVMLPAPAGRTFLQHDGAHHFDLVVRDLASLSFVKEKIECLAIQDTHLRGYPKYCNFVDAAVCGVFGFDLKFISIGSAVSPENTLLTTPNQYQGNYFLPDVAEGWFIPFELNTFKYPHPSIPLDAFIEGS